MLKTSARWVHRLLVSILILLGLTFAGIVLGLRYWFLPNISDYRETIATSISQAAAQRVTIGQIEAGWDGLRPHLNMRDVDVFDASGNPALRLDHIEGTLAWWNLLLGEIRLHSLEMDQPNLALRRTAKGEIFIGGVWVNQPGIDSGFADWLLRQHRIIVRGATLTWQDELRQAPLLELKQVNLRLENRGRHHRFGLRAVPPPSLALPLDIRGDLKGEGLNDIFAWSGTLYSQVDYTDVSQWRSWVDLPFQLERGQGGVRLWLDMDGKTLKSLAVDLKLQDVLARLRPDLPQLDMAQLGGRLSWSDLNPGQQMQSRGFAFRLRDGTAFGPSNASLKLLPPNGKRAARSELKFERLDLGPLVALARYLPVDDQVRAALHQAQPKGSLGEFLANWDGLWPEMKHYSVRGKLSNISMQPYTLASGAQLPGFVNLSGNLDSNEKSGVLHLNSRQFRLRFPQLFEHALELDALNVRLSWSKEGTQREFKLSSAALANSHLAGNAFGTYRTTQNGPGVIDLSAQFNRADARFVSHYMPLVIGQETRDWLARSLKGGHAGNVQLKLKGDLAKFPFEDSKSGLFQVSVKAKGGVLEYAPGWPAIEGISLDLLFHGKRMDLYAHEGHTYGMKISKVHAQIPDLIVSEEMLLIDGVAQGPTQEMLKFIEQSPVSAMIDDFSQGMQANGNGKLNLNLKIPLRRLDDIGVAGSYLFQNNKVVLRTGMPPLDQVNGALQFTGGSVAIPNITAQFLGGGTSIKAATQQGVIQINASGKLTASGLGKAFPHPLLQRLQGSANWGGSITLRKKLADAVFTSNLIGLGSSLPQPFNKVAGESVKLRLEQKNTISDQDTINVSYGNILAAQFERQLQSGQMQVARGTVQLGGGPLAMPSSGIWLNGSLAYLDIDHWRDLSSGKSSNGDGFAIDGANLKFSLLDAYGKRFKDLNVHALRQNDAWRAELESQEMIGNVDWKPGGAGLLRGRFKTLSIPQAAPPKLGEPGSGGETTEFPALDIVADSFSIRNKQLGRLELLAAPSGNDWRINRLKLNTPETSLSLEGVWQDWLKQPRSQFSLQLETSDIGKLLARVGHPDSVRGGNAVLKGQLAWNGGPADIHYPSLSGTMSLEAHKGQFLKIEPGLGKLLGILSLQALPRRITLDFRDVFSDGFAFDDLAANVKASQGIVSGNDFRMDGPAAKVSMQGETSLAQETQNLRVRVVPVLSDTFSGAAALLAGPVVGLTSLLVQKVLKDPIGQIAAYEYSITGTWDNPVIAKIKKSGGDNKSWEAGS